MNATLIKKGATSMRKFFLIAAALLVVIACTGCQGAKAEGDANANARRTDESGQVSPSERYERERIERALTGLDIEGGRVEVDRSVSGAIAQPGTRAQAAAASEQGRHLYELNDTIGAIAAFAKSIIIDESYADAYLGLAKALHANGEPNETLAALHTALGLNGELKEGHYLLAQIYQEAGNLNQQIAVLLGIAKRWPGYLETESRLAIAYYYSHDYGSAWKFVHRSEDLGKAVPPQFRELLAGEMREPARP
ncbi:MAG TPA: hypothetical protein VFG65_03860 [Fimbriimonadales bacterium]|nr:hypothetical protein [Fimbriimonadales bacterium]